MSGAIDITDDRLGRLTPREREVFERLGDGVSGQAVAATLGLSVKTVHGHVAVIGEKLGICGIHDLRYCAVRWSLKRERDRMLAKLIGSLEARRKS